MDPSNLHNVPLLQDLAPEELTALAGVGHEQTFGANVPIIREGDPGDTLYVLLEGSVAVTKGAGGDRPMLLHVATQGEYFGEMALLDALDGVVATEVRSANVVALEPVRCFCLVAAAFRAFLADRPRVGERIFRAFARTMSARIRRLTEKLQGMADAGVAIRTATETTRHELAGAIAQAVRTPVTVLKGTADLLAEAAIAPERGNRLLQMMEAQAAQLTAFLADVGHFIAATRGGDAPKRAIQFQGLLQEVLEDCEPAMAQRRIRFTANIPADLPPITVVPEHLHKVLAHLLANGIRYNREAGELTLSAQLTPSPSEERNVPPSPFGERSAKRQTGSSGARETFRTDDAAEGVRASWEEGSAPPYVEVRIHDTGPGLPRPVRDRLQESSAGGIPLMPRPDGGVGIGLALARKLIEMHGGKLWVESEPGEGTTVYFTIPNHQ